LNIVVVAAAVAAAVAVAIAGRTRQQYPRTKPSLIAFDIKTIIDYMHTQAHTHTHTHTHTDNYNIQHMGLTAYGTSFNYGLLKAQNLLSFEPQKRKS